MDQPSNVALEQLPEVPRSAWTRLRNELLALMGNDLVAIWGHGGTVALEGPRRSADLDTYVVVRRPIDASTGHAIEAIQQAIARDSGLEWDSWYVVEADARRSAAPPHAFHSNRRDTSWAIHRAHWLAGRYAPIHGPEPGEVVPPPLRSELDVDLDRELEHIERHVAEGDTDPYEATYAVLNGSRILHVLQTGDVAISKRAAGQWAIEHLPLRWHAALRAASRAYDGEATSADTDLIAGEMAPFVAMVRQQLPSARLRTAGWQPRWSGY